MKKYLVVLLMLAGISSFANTSFSIDEKILRSFNALFPNAEQIKWDESPEAFTIHFSDGGIRSRIVFEKDRPLVTLTRYYMEQDLPYSVLLKLKKEFHDKKITGVTEISTHRQLGNYLQEEFYIKLEDNKNLMTVKLKRNGKFTVLEKLRKAA